MIGLIMAVGEIIRGAQAPRLPVSAPSPKHFRDISQVRAGEGAATHRRAPGAPRNSLRRTH